MAHLQNKISQQLFAGFICFAVLFMGVLNAQETDTMPTPPTIPENNQLQEENSQQILFNAQTLIGANVQNDAGEDIGEIEDLMVDLNSGQISFAVLSFGGILGIGEKHFAVPWDKLQIAANGNQIIFNVNRDILDRAPYLEGDESDKSWQEEVKEFWNRTFERERTRPDTLQME